MTRQWEVASDEAALDVRRLLRLVYHYRFLWIGQMLLVMVLVGAYQKFGRADEYRSSSYVLITEPSLTMEFDARVQTSATVPDLNSLKELAVVDTVIQNVYQQALDTGVIEASVTISAMRDDFEVSLVGKNQLQLEVTTRNPEQASELANIWADVFAAHLNGLFGVNQDSLAQLEKQRELARLQWEEAETALQERLPVNSSAILEVNLSQSREALRLNLAKITAIDLIVSDAQAFMSRLEAQDVNAPLQYDDALILVSLQQQTAGSSQTGDVNIQLLDRDFFADDYTVAQARANLENVISSLLDQKSSLGANLSVLEKAIVENNQALLAARYEEASLDVERDLALDSYQALSSYLEESQIRVAQNSSSAKVSSYSIPHYKSLKEPVIVVSGIAALVTFVLFISGLFAHDWWIGTEEPSKHVFQVALSETNLAKASVKKE